MAHFILRAFLIWRLCLFLFAAIGEKYITFTPRFPYSDIFLIPSKLPSFLWSFANFDGVHYLTIAKSGYSAQFTQVFFPLFPLIIRIIQLFLPFISPIVLGLFLSNLFFFLALIVFGRLLSFDYKSQQIKWMILFLLFFPTSFFFGSLYTESLFLFLVLSSFYAARKKKWLLSGILGGLASATRLVGIFLLPALIWEYWSQNKLKNKKVSVLFPSPRGSPDVHPRGGFKALLNLLSKYYLKILHSPFSILHSPILYLVPLGLLSYMLYLQLKFGDWLYFWHVQPVFGAERSGASFVLLPQVVWRYIKILFNIPLFAEIFWISFLELLSTIFAIILLTIAHFKKIRPSYLIFSWLCVVVPPLTGTFSSMPRYILAAFPIFIVLGLGRNKVLKTLLLATCFLLLTILTLLFTRGHWVS